LSCSGTETVEPVNQPPTIQFTFDKIAVRKGWDVDLSVNVGDPDGDPLKVTWEISSGTWVSQNPENTIVRWTPLNSLGMDTVVVTVTDGEETASTDLEEIKRGTWRRLGSDLTNIRFTKSDSPWIISTNEDAVRIDAGWTVPIDSGVEMYIDTPGFLFEVVGTFKSNGTEAEPVVIKPNNRHLTCGTGGGWWEGIRVITDSAISGLVDFDYTEIWHAEYDVRTFEYQDQGGASVKLNHCLIVCSSTAGILMGSNGSLELDHCQISNNQSHGILISAGVALPSRVDITNCDISDNHNTGIYMDLNDTTQTVPINITGNRFRSNWIDGIAMTEAAWPAVIQNNDFFFNSRSHIRLITPYPNQVNVPADWDSLHAKHNFWGTPYDPGNDALIELKIWDRRDDRNIGTTVIVAPWKNDPQYNP
jgi:hypothetical protein